MKINTDLGRFSLIDDEASRALATDRSSEHLRGYTGRNYDRHPFGSMPWRNMPIRTIPRSEWKDRIEEGNAKKLFAFHHNARAKVPILNQRQTNYCWINAVVGAIMAVRAQSGLPTVNLSSASAGAPGKNYRNVGGWTGEAIGYIQEYGLVPHELWPNDAIQRSYFRETRDVAKHFGVGQWWELRPKSFDEVMTCCLLGLPVAVGLLWWGHAVYYSAPVAIGANEFGVICDNSWGERWEEQGRVVLAESKATPDEANAIVTPVMDGDTAEEAGRVSFVDTLGLAV